MVAIEDKLRVTQFFKQGSIEARMVSFWEVMSITGGVDPFIGYLARDFHNNWHERYNTILHNTAVLYRTIVDVAPDFDVYGDYGVELAGTGGGDPAPSYVAVQIKQNVSSRITRAGYKRFPFVTESVIDGNALSIGGAFLVDLQTFYGELAVIPYEDDPEVDSWSLRPIIVGRTNIGTPEAPDYVLDFAKINVVSSASVLKNTHQISRDT